MTAAHRLSPVSDILQWLTAPPVTVEWLLHHIPNNGRHGDHCIPKAGGGNQSPLVKRKGKREGVEEKERSREESYMYMCKG